MIFLAGLEWSRNGTRPGFNAVTTNTIGVHTAAARALHALRRARPPDAPLSIFEINIMNISDFRASTVTSKIYIAVPMVNFQYSRTDSETCPSRYASPFIIPRRYACLTIWKPSL
jgi:hypothetical protein